METLKKKNLFRSWCNLVCSAVAFPDSYSYSNVLQLYGEIIVEVLERGPRLWGFFCAGFGIVSLWQGCDLHRQKMFDQGCISMYLARRASYSIPYWKFASLCEYVHWKLILNVMLLGPITKLCLWSFLQKKGNPKERVNAVSARDHNPQQIFTHYASQIH